jgi:hypothetical protein
MQFTTDAGTIMIELDDILIVPFGRPKWEIEKIRVVAVSTTKTYIESSAPCAVIERWRERALTLEDFCMIVPDAQGVDTISDERQPDKAPWAICEYLKSKCEVQTDFEARFLEVYFRRCMEIASRCPDKTFSIRLPLPQAHLYLDDPLREKKCWWKPEFMVKVDFAFWTGKGFVAVEIDGASHIGNPKHIEKDRALQRAGVEVIHILNSELLEHAAGVLNLLPTSVTDFCDAWGGLLG